MWKNAGVYVSDGRRKRDGNRMIRKLLTSAALLLGVLALVGPATPASAGGGPADYADCVVTVDPSTFGPGDTVTVTGTGLEPNFETTIEFNSVTEVVGTVTTDENGSFETQVQIPDDATAVITPSPPCAMPTAT